MITDSVEWVKALLGSGLVANCGRRCKDCGAKILGRKATRCSECYDKKHRAYVAARPQPPARMRRIDIPARRSS